MMFRLKVLSKTSFEFKQSIFFNIESDGRRKFLLRPECNDSLEGLQTKGLKSYRHHVNDEKSELY